MCFNSPQVTFIATQDGKYQMDYFQSNLQKRFCKYFNYGKFDMQNTTANLALKECQAKIGSDLKR